MILSCWSRLVDAIEASSDDVVVGAAFLDTEFGPAADSSFVTLAEIFR